jgi:hypothetical protein
LLWLRFQLLYWIRVVRVDTLFSLLDFRGKIFSLSHVVWCWLWDLPYIGFTMLRCELGTSFLQPAEIFLCSVLCSFTVIWCGEGLLQSCLPGVLSASCIWTSMSFSRFGTFSAIISLNRFLYL